MPEEEGLRFAAARGELIGALPGTRLAGLMVIDTSVLTEPPGVAPVPSIDLGAVGSSLVHRRLNGAEPQSGPTERTTSGVD